MIKLFSFLIFIFVSCQGDDSPDDSSGTPSKGASGEIADTSANGIKTFIETKSFLQWSNKQSAPIDGVSAHRGISQTYINDTAYNALKESKNPLPLGSILVKAMYAADRTTVTGHALMAKVSEGSGEDSWVWYEGFLPDYSGPYYGKGLSLCTSCHTTGIDYTRTGVDSFSK